MYVACSEKRGVDANRDVRRMLGTIDLGAVKRMFSRSPRKLCILTC